jgi:hypothetical protein
MGLEYIKAMLEGTSALFLLTMSFLFVQSTKRVLGLALDIVQRLRKWMSFNNSPWAENLKNTTFVVGMSPDDNGPSERVFPFPSHAGIQPERNVLSMLQE